METGFRMRAKNALSREKFSAFLLINNNRKIYYDDRFGGNGQRFRQMIQMLTGLWVGQGLSW
jgi:hypothetical protein